jgi:predicted esterase
VPSTNRDGPLPLLVFLHGATQNGAGILRRIGPAADALGIAVLAPDSRGRTWDAITDGFGEDVTFLNRTLEFVLDRLPVDPVRLTVGGFSDGASYALSLGLDNGDLCSHDLALSPGFAAPPSPRGAPRFCVSHGTHGTVRPIAHCSRRSVPALRNAGRTVEYNEYDGGHEIPGGGNGQGNGQPERQLQEVQR